MPAFTTKITHARFTFSPVSAEQMAIIGESLRGSIMKRIQSATDVTDSPAKPIVERYAKRKIAHGRAPIRDWTWRGLTLGSFKVKRASESIVVIGFVNPQANFIAHMRNLKDHMFGVSPKDHEVLAVAVRSALMTSPFFTVSPGIRTAYGSGDSGFGLAPSGTLRVA